MSSLNEADQAILDFRNAPEAWRQLLMECCGGHPPPTHAIRHHEVHAYCTAEEVTSREAISESAQKLGLPTFAFSFSHEVMENGNLAQVSKPDQRKEWMISTHFLCPSHISSVLAERLRRTFDKVGIPIERIRVERPLGRLPRARNYSNDAGWWEAHFGTHLSPSELFLAVRHLPIRDISVDADFREGNDVREMSYANIEMKNRPEKLFGDLCMEVESSLRQLLGSSLSIEMEQVIYDG